MQMIKERDVRSLLEAQEASYREMVRSPEKSKAEFFSQFVWDEDWESAYGLLKGRSHSGFFGLRDPEECLIRKIDTFEVAKHSLVFTPVFSQALLSGAGLCLPGELPLLHREYPEILYSEGKRALLH